MTEEATLVTTTEAIISRFAMGVIRDDAVVAALVGFVRYDYRTLVRSARAHVLLRFVHALLRRSHVPLGLLVTIVGVDLVAGHGHEAFTLLACRRLTFCSIKRTKGKVDV